MVANMLGNDLVINEDSCNLSCAYCLTGQSNLKSTHREQLIFNPPFRDRYVPDNALGERLNLVDQRVDARLEVPLLKVTGGEIFLVDNVLDFVEEQSRHHVVVVVQTNGMLVNDEHLARLKTWPNLVLQVSLDSHLFHGNSYRVATSSLHNKVLRRVRAILESGIPTEVYAVLSDRSVEEMPEFASWLSSFASQPTYCPFPVRGPDAARFQVRPDQVAHIEAFATRLDEFAAVVPPAPYFARLLSFYREGKRTFRCHLPRLVVSTFSDGMVTPCPNIWFSDMGNLVTDADDKVLDRIGSTGLYRALLAERPRLAACHGCFTPWDTLSMYFDDEITLDELCAAPTYNFPEIRTFLADAKQAYRTHIG